MLPTYGYTGVIVEDGYRSYWGGPGEMGGSGRSLVSIDVFIGRTAPPALWPV